MKETPSVDGHGVGGVAAESARVTLDALPLPALCLDRFGTIRCANRLAADLIGAGVALAGQPLLAFSAGQQGAGESAAAVLESLLHQAAEGRASAADWQLAGKSAAALSVRLHLSGDPARGFVAVLCRPAEPAADPDVAGAEREVLEAMVAGQPLSATACAIARHLERLLPGSVCSVLALDAESRTVHHLASGSLPEDYCKAVNGLRIGPRLGSCGSAMWHRQTTITRNIETDCRWAPFLPLTRAAGLRACWSEPVIAYGGQVLGSLALYWYEPRDAGPGALALMRRFAGLLALSMERERDAERLRQSEAVFRSAFERAAIGMAHLSSDGRMLKANGPLCELLGYREGQLRRRRMPELVHPEERPRLAELGEQIARGHHDTLQTELRLMRADGASVWASVAAAPVYDADGAVDRVVAVVSDISRSRELADELAYRSTHDWLTGLHNRFELERQLAQWLGRRPEARSGAAFCHLDLDQFRLVNDSAGRAAGDALLCRAAELISACLDDGAIAARLAGDEFGVLIPDTGPEAAIANAERIREALEAAGFEWQGSTFRISASIGVVHLPEASLRSVDWVLQAADTAAATAKEAGRNRFAVWDRRDARIDRRHGDASWVPRLMEALDTGSFRLDAQPIVAVGGSAGEPRRYELLVRMAVDGAWVLPGRFLPAAERYGIAPQIDRWVVEQALDWLEQRPGLSVRLAVNLSGLSVTHRDFRRFVIAALQRYPVSARRLCFEITETAAIADIDEARALIGELRELGCELALDDFGSGLSSFGYLQQLPVDLLKIDGSFVRDIVDDPVSRAFVKSIADIARVMEKRTIAEFVESEAVLAVLGELGVDLVQGFCLGKPTPLDALAALPDVAGRAIGGGER